MRGTHLLSMDTWVFVRVAARESDDLVISGLAIAVAANLQLSARRVELGSALVLAEVQGDDFVTDEVVAGLDVGREGDIGWDIKVD